jgi:hypothetical protein
VVPVLDQVQVLDQQVTPARPVAKQLLDLVGGRGIDLAAFRRCLCPFPSLSRMFERANLMHVMSHE